MKKNILTITTFTLFLQISFSQDRYITRGATPGELYMTNLWYGIYEPILGPPFYTEVRDAIYRLSQNGKKMSIQYEESYFVNPQNVMFPQDIIADATPGVVYNKQNYIKNSITQSALWVSFDYGKNWVFREEISANSTGYYISNLDGGIFRAADSGEHKGTYKSNDYAVNFFLIDDRKLTIKETGLNDCEFFALIGREFYHTFDCYQNYINIPIDSQFVFGNMAGLFPDVYRGALPGEVYIDSWFLDRSYKVSFSDNYGDLFRFVYICTEDCLNPSDGVKTYFMSDREPGVFYIIKERRIETKNPWGYYMQFCVSYYRDYGETLVATYCHDLTPDYGSVCEPVTGLTATQSDIGNALVSWQDESSLPVDSFLVFRKKIGSGGTGLWELASRNFGNELFYLDENLPDGLYEYYVVTYYVTGCIAKYSDIVQVYVGFCEAVNDLSSEVVNDKNVLLNWSLSNSDVEVEGYAVYRNNELVNSELVNENFYLDENLPVGVYEYYVVARYSNGCVSANSNIETVNIDYVGIENPELYSGTNYEILVYPNPFINEINISNPIKVKSVQISNLAGQKVKDVVFDGKTIKTGNIGCGVYFVIVESVLGERKVYKMIKR